jgi:FemAB-related protein (PEP-CTERM system-associated)
MAVRLAGAGDRRAIDSYILESGSSSLYHGYLWGVVIEKSFGHKYYCLLCEGSDGKPGGILPLVHMKSRLFGNMLVSMPFLNYGGVCAENARNRDLLLEEAIRIARELDADHIEFRQEKPLENGFPVKTHKVSMRLELPGSADALWESFPAKLRSQIRRSQREEMVVRIGGNEELESFYKVFSLCMRNLGTPVYPKHFFRNVLDHFPDCTWICSVYLRGLPVASGFLTGFKNRLEIPWGSSDSRYNRLGTNMLLYWSCLRFACEKGFTEFDFGRSTFGEGTYKFKEQWGAVSAPLHWHYWLREGGTIPDLTPRNPKYELAIALWKKLPVAITKALGPRIIRNIP